ncbi:hypothetical protein [Nonomuraea turcica]|uniref:hypothetical protein n=1 Tax=Nonomuraea sp. G32 TaxID=3067274 RepID=UPI00273C9607|nr:hypothetical protein [Nonomuraea sp. G32]MDP4510066.1 hypothetical protein [Nonomuraea sp. G32]
MRRTRNAGRRLQRALLGQAAGLVAYAMFVRPRLLRWGATREEVHDPLPGDAAIPLPHIVATRAITIDAPPEAVWPWLVQMGGYTRAGWYGYDAIDNGGMPSARRIIPELQKLDVGDLLLTSRSGTGYRVELVERERALVLAIRAFHVTEIWAIVLRDLGGRTRMLFRLRVLCRPGLLGLIYLLLSQSADYVTARKQMTTIKALAEGGSGGLRRSHDRWDQRRDPRP